MPLYDFDGNVLDIVNAVKYNSSPNLIKITEESTGTMQGGCSDGTFIYYCIYSQNKLFKLNPLTGEKTSITYESGLYGHANDMTYNPVTGKVYIVTMDSGVIRIVNPATLADEGSFVPVNASGATVYSSGIAYDRTNDRFILTSSHSYAIFDGEWNFIKSFTYTADSNWTYQGLETDGEYIFRPVWASSGSSNAALVLDFDGNLLMQIDVPSNLELETIANDWNGVWYAIFNNNSGGADVDLIGLPASANFHAVEVMHKILNL